MSRGRVITLLVATFVVAQVAPAFGAPSLASLIERVDQREQRHYASLDRRIKLLTLNQSIKTQTVKGVMFGSSANPRYYSGSAVCPSRTRLTGGGVDWSPSDNYADRLVVSSAPDPGAVAVAWNATVSVGGSGRLSVPPRVYAICARI